MKRKITIDELKEISRIKFDTIIDIKDKIKELKRKLIDLCIKKEILKNKYIQLKREYNKILDTLIGKGEYYKIISRPMEIKEKLSILEDSIYDSYKRSVDKNNEKRFNLLKDVLNEDLKIANKELDDFNTMSLAVETDYHKTSEEYKECKKQIRNIMNKIKILEQLQNRLLVEIRDLNCAYKNDKKINVKKLLKE